MGGGKVDVKVSTSTFIVHPDPDSAQVATLEVSCHSSLQVKSIKGMVQKFIGLSSKQQRLELRGEQYSEEVPNYNILELYDESTLFDYNLHNGATLWLVWEWQGNLEIHHEKG